MRNLLCGLILTMLLPLAACGGSSSSSLTIPGATISGCAKNSMALPGSGTAVNLPFEATLSASGSCGASGPTCPSGSSCVHVFLDSGTVGPCCIEEAMMWKTLKCSSGQLVSLDSYPAMIICDRR